MSGIQWLLLILVVAAVAVAYWYLRRQAGNDPWQGMDDDSGGDRGEPSPEDSYIVGVRTLSGGGAKDAQASSGEESLFVLHVAGRDGAFFDGPDVHAALRVQELEFGLHDIYHRVTEANGAPESVYSVANMLKPGYLDPAEEDHLRTPGLALFLVLPGPLEGVPAMRDMLDTAHALADALGGEVLDDKRTLLTPQARQYLLDQVAELDRRQRVRANR